MSQAQDDFAQREEDVQEARDLLATAWASAKREGYVDDEDGIARGVLLATVAVQLRQARAVETVADELYRLRRWLKANGLPTRADLGAAPQDDGPVWTPPRSLRELAEEARGREEEDRHRASRHGEAAGEGRVT